MKYSVDDVIKNILQIRNKKKITQKDIGAALCVTEATYNRIESGKISLSYLNLTKIASFFDMSVIDILTYPETFQNSNPPKTRRIFVELELTDEEFEEKGLKDQLFKVLSK